MHGLVAVSLFFILVNYLCTFCLAAPTRRPSERSNQELWADLHFFLGYLPDFLVRRLDERPLQLCDGRDAPRAVVDPRLPHCRVVLLCELCVITFLSSCSTIVDYIHV
jgi:hypothetical protein